MNKKRLNRSITTILLLITITSSFYLEATFKGQLANANGETTLFSQSEENDNQIVILYNKNNDLMNGVAQTTLDILLTTFPNAKKVCVNSISELENNLNDNPWIILYAFDSDISGINLEHTTITWELFYNILKSYDNSEHIVGMANTLSLETVMGEEEIDNIYTSESEQTDALLLMMYNIWAVSEILCYRAIEDNSYEYISEQFKQIALQIYGDNFNTLFQIQLEPINIVGEINPDELDSRTQEMWDDHKPQIEETAYVINETGDLTEISKDSFTEDFSPVIALAPSSSYGIEDFLLGDLPLISGLNGPIGDIVDTLLDVLALTGNPQLSIPKEVMETIKTSITTLQSVIGLVDDFNMESALKLVIDQIANEFPFIEEQKGYLTIFTKALFNMRGDNEAVLEIVMELVQELIGDLLPESVGGFVEDVLNIGDELNTLITDVKDNGKNIFDALGSFFASNVAGMLLNKTLNATLGINQEDVNKILPKMNILTKATMNFLVSFDVKQLINTIGGELMEEILGTINPQIQQGLDKFKAILNLTMGVVDLVDNFEADSVLTLVADGCRIFIGDENITTDINVMAQDIMYVVKQYMEGTLSNIVNFKNEVIEQLNKHINENVPQSTRDLIAEVLAMIAGVYNSGFDKSGLPDLFELAESVAEQFIPAENVTAIKDAFNGAVKPIMGLVSYITGSSSLKQMMNKSLSGYSSVYEAIPDLLKQALTYFDNASIFEGVENFNETIDCFGQITGSFMTLLSDVKGKSFTGILKSVFLAVGSIVGIHPSFNGVPIDAFLDLVKSFFPNLFGLSGDEIPDKTETINQLLNATQGKLTGVIDQATFEVFLNSAMDLRGLFTDGLDWIVGKIMDWMQGLISPLIKDLEKSINDALIGDDGTPLLGFKGTIPIGLGQWSLFDLEVDLGVSANFSLDQTRLMDLVKSLILDGRSTLSLDSLESFFDTIFSFFEISPQFHAKLGVKGLDTSKNSFMKYMMESLGVDLVFSGSAKFVMTLFTFRDGKFDWEDFFNILAWEFNIKVQVQKQYTLLDFLTGGVGGSTVTKVAKYINLDVVKMTVYLSLSVEIIKKAAMADSPEISTITVVLTIGASINSGINLYLVKIKITGALEIIFTFFMDMASNAPMKITLQLLVTLKAKFKYAYSSSTKNYSWQPSGSPWDLSPNKGDDEYNESGLGLDTDGDGLGDEYELTIPGLDPLKPDTDDDGASDKLEVKTMGTDPINPDTDDDGLLDGEEWELGTNPRQVDTDYDKLSDYDEVIIFMTNPLCQDTDGDALSDYYEINTPIDITNVTVTVSEIIIGGVTYIDRTDPLNPDTDGDGLRDGQEGFMGAYYGLDSLYDETVSDDDPLIYNYGYTHPLDADTDDDSYLQLYNGQIDSQASNNYLMDMNDGAEVRGFLVIFYNLEGEPEEKLVFTNPVNPDTDGDTGITDRTPQAGMWINSDGYELAQNPPTDPTDGDTDDDGLIDGIEGVLNPLSNHTNPNDADTDDDGLNDMQEILLGTDPRVADSDFDTIPDGAEFYVFYTNPNNPDSDFDGLDDGEEVYLWHSNPLADDSDGDGLLDGDEILIYRSDPMDDDSDNDGLNDFKEILIYYTDPFEYDSDGDGLSDGEEILTYITDPLNWDTDYDSILDLNEFGEITWSMSDYDEVKTYGTDPTKPDTDEDGLNDGIELYLASGIIPWTDPILINPLNNDTDGDGFVDGEEIQLKNVTNIIYPYISTTLIYPFNSSPVLYDSDNDNISDYIEVIDYHSDPMSNDTDGDGLTDWEEIQLGLSPIYNDTDGDGLLDSEEITGIYLNANELTSPHGIPVTAANYITDPLNPDSDGDGLPDGAEVLFYFTSPNGANPITSFDSDYDGLFDAIEFELELEKEGGGFLVPDTDEDGLLDGDEYYIYNTNLTLSDTDGDSYSDGTEVAIGTDPLVWTTAEEYEERMAYQRALGVISILLPKFGDDVYVNTPLVVVNFTSFETMSYRFDNGSGWSNNVEMIYDQNTQQWSDNDAIWPVSSYKIKITAIDYDGKQYIIEFEFRSKETPNYGSNLGWILLVFSLITIIAFLGVISWKNLDQDAKKRVYEYRDKTGNKLKSLSTSTGDKLKSLSSSTKNKFKSVSDSRNKESNLVESQSPSITEQNSKPVEKTSIKLAKKTVSKPINKTVSRSVNKNRNKPATRVIKKPVNKTVSKSAKKVIKEPVSKTVSKSAKKVIKKPVNKTVSKPVKKTIKKSTLKKTTKKTAETSKKITQKKKNTKKTNNSSKKKTTKRKITKKTSMKKKKSTKKRTKKTTKRTSTKNSKEGTK